MLALTKIVLELEGYWVLTASQGKEALEKFASHPVDAVVLDYELPRMNGAEVAWEIKRLKPRPEIGVYLSCQDSCGRRVTGIVNLSVKACQPQDSSQFPPA
jgi:CheY-like chemotaxis protein